MENPLLELAQAYADTTNTLIFLTGKAGTGKTTFLRRICQSVKKKLIIVAPTGVAAINAGGMTIHSFFQLPFGPLLPGSAERPELSYNAEKRELLQNLELLIIDEISMVRPDVLDQLDLILRNIRGNRHAFGGIQLLLIGDLAQLSPIIRDEEWTLLRSYYATPYFFSSQVLQRTPYVRIELDKVYRQNDQSFIEILNEMREQQMSAAGLEKLNARYVPGFKPAPGDSYITLTTHNRIAQQINAEWLEALTGPEVEYKASIRGEFPTDAYPTDISLKLKAGAQVMFVKNDNSPEKKYYNGKIGTITRLEADTVHVKTEDGLEIAVQALEWSNIKYQMEGDEIKEDNAGSFAQIPLKPAWAITIHKSQGLTFDKAIVDVSEAFTHGQAYVALSRCRSLEGLILRNPVKAQNVIGDPAVKLFNQMAEQQRPNQELLKQHQDNYRTYLLTELFNFSGLKEKMNKFESLLPALPEEVFAVAEKLPAQLPKYTDERIRKAAAYFHTKMEAAAADLHRQLSLFVGTSKDLAEKADSLLRWIMSRLNWMETFRELPFTTDAYLHLLRQPKETSGGSYLKALSARQNEKLYEQLLEWRDKTAQAENMLSSMLFTEQTLVAIAARLPATLKVLSGIRGVGPEKTNRYGSAILTMIRAYLQESNGTDSQASLF